MTPTPNLRRHAAVCLLLAAWAVAPRAAAQTAAPDSAAPAEAVELTDEQKIAALDARLVANPADGRAWNDLGVLHARRGDFGLARDAFIHAVQANPREGDYHRNLGLAFSRLEDPELAIREFEAYRRFDQLGSQDYWRLIGGAQARAGLVDEAEATLREGLAAVAPGGAEHLRLGLALNKLEADRGDEQAARRVLEEFAPAAQAFLRGNDPAADGWPEAEALVGNRVALLVEDGKLMEASGLFAEAARAYETAYELSPARDDLLPRLVDVHLKAGDSMAARVAARLARDAHPDRAGTWIATAKVHEQTNRLEDAVEAYQRAFAIDPEFPDLRLAIGNLLMRLGRDKEAGAFLRQGVTSGNTKPEVVYNYAVSQIREGNHHAAIASLRMVVDQRPDMTPAWIALAQSLRVTKQYGAAVEPYRRALELQPDARLAYNLGICAQKADLHDQAIAAYEQALGMDPTMVEARYNLSLTYMDAKRYEDAVASFALMQELEPGSYRLHYSQGLSYYYLGRWDEALEAFDAAAEQKETRALLNNIGLVYEAKGDKTTAQKWYKLAKESGG
ncbi:MAG: tetratricopeptide repeat protein [Candidatus Krumholzibacteriia bacterium]